MRGIFGKDKNFPDRCGNEPEVFGFIWLITLGVFAFKSSTGDFKLDSSLFSKSLSFLIVGICVFAVGYSFFWLRHIIKKREKIIEEFTREKSF